jgi:hypothetical protein
MVVEKRAVAERAAVEAWSVGGSEDMVEVVAWEGVSMAGLDLNGMAVAPYVFSLQTKRRWKRNIVERESIGNQYNRLIKLGE